MNGKPRGWEPDATEDELREHTELERKESEIRQRRLQIQYQAMHRGYERLLARRGMNDAR